MPNSESAAVSAWLAKFEAALSTANIKAAAALFDDECYWRDLVSFTWNIITLEGAAAGAETELRKRPGTVEVSFELPDDQNLIVQVIEVIFQTHSYQEPVIRLQNILASRSKGLDDSKNPNRWWNTTGDWKAKSENKSS